MIGQLTSGHVFSSEVVESVNERASGVPLFIEEVTRLLLERGDRGGAQTIPFTLHQSLAARLDRLGHAREIAQIGAVLGREFSYGLLQAVAGVEDSLLQSALSRLAEADILIVGEVGPQANYRFRHALIQDAAYESLLKSRRQALHRRAAEILRDESERAAIEPEAIARHFTQAGLDELAIEWWGKAGEQALQRSAFSEAVSHLRKAIEMADAGPAQTSEPPETRNWRLKLHADYAIAVAWATGYTSDRTAVAMAEARDLAVRSGGASERFASYYGQWTNHISRDEMRLAREVAEAFLADADSGSDDEGRFVAESMLGVIHYFTGHFAMARDVLELATSSAPCPTRRGTTIPVWPRHRHWRDGLSWPGPLDTGRFRALQSDARGRRPPRGRIGPQADARQCSPFREHRACLSGRQRGAIAAGGAPSATLS